MRKQQKNKKKLKKDAECFVRNNKNTFIFTLTLEEIINLKKMKNKVNKFLKDLKDLVEYNLRYLIIESNREIKFHFLITTNENISQLIQRITCVWDGRLTYISKEATS